MKLKIPAEANLCLFVFFLIFRGNTSLTYSITYDDRPLTYLFVKREPTSNVVPVTFK